MTTAVAPGISAQAQKLYGIVGFEPHEEQIPFLACKKRFLHMAGGEQGGKSACLAKKFLSNWAEDQGKYDNYGDGINAPLLYWLIGSAYGETIKEFSYIADDLRTLGQPVKQSSRVDPGYIEIKFPDERRPRLRIETKSATDITKMSKDSPHGIIICEPGQVDVLVFDRAQGRITPMNGWLLMAGTFESSVGWFPQLWEAWQSGADDRQSFSLPSWANRTLYPGGRNDPKILDLERHSSDQFFMERIAGHPVPPKGLVFNEFRADIHIKDISYIPDEHVYLGEDPGYGSQSAHALEVCHIIDGQVQVFDEIFEQGLTTEEIIRIAQSRPWWRERDHAGITFVSDPNYRNQHHSMTSVEEQWFKDTGLVARGKKIRINEGTERMKGFLKPDPIFRTPKVVFSPHVKGILSEFGVVPNPFDGQIRPYKWKTDREGTIIGETPEDMWNHGLKGLIYLITEVFGLGYAASKKIMVKHW